MIEDRLIRFKTAYRDLPCCIRNALGGAYYMLPATMRYGPFHGEYQMRIRSFRECAGRDHQKSMQWELLRKTVNFAVQHVPFYHGYSEIQTAEDLRAFPIVDRSILSGRRDDFVADVSRKYKLAANTGGSSGSPLSFYLHKGLSRPKEKAHFDWFWGQFGYSPGARLLMVRGAPLRRNALYEYQAIENRLALSCFELNEANVEQAIAVIKRFKPEFVYAYPSALKILTQLIEDPKRILDGIVIKAMFLGSEGIDPIDRAYLCGFYASRVVSWYGHSECAVHAGNTIDSDEYHFYPFYGHIELLDESGQPVTRPGDRGRIVATSFDNFVMPFIRYDTGDIGVLSERTIWSDPVACIVLRQIEGRSQDYIVLKNGTRVSATAFIGTQLHSPQFAVVREMQLQQDRRGELLVRVVPRSSFKPEHVGQMNRVLLKSVSGQLSINFEVVEQIAKTRRGKHRFLIRNYVGDAGGEAKRRGE